MVALQSGSEQRNTSPTVPAPAKTWARWLAIAVVYMVALDWVALRFEVRPEIAVWYPPSGLSVALLRIFGLRFTPLLFLNTYFHYWLVGDRIQDPGTMFVAAIATSVGYAAGVFFLLRIVKIDPRLPRLRDAGWFIGIAAFVAPLLVGVVQGLNLAQADGFIQWSSLVTRMFQYTSGDGTGIGMLAVPLIVLLRAWPSL